MQQQTNLIENLISLRNHYQGCLEEYERSATHALEQLTHINALLVDQLVENQQIVQSLIELRSHYLSRHEKYQRTTAHAKEQLTHVKALIADELWLQHQRQQPVSIEAAKVDQQEQLSLKAAVSAEREASPQPLEQPEQPDLLDATAPSFLNHTTTQELKESEPIAFSDVEESSLYFPTVKTPMLPKYQNMTKTQAVEHLLGEHEGTILHVEYILRALYGTLDAEAIKSEKPRIYDTLSRGVEKGLWDKVPDQASCYTIDLKLVEAEETSAKTAQTNKASSQNKKQQSRNQHSEEMLPRYQQFNFTEAVAAVVNENPGQILTTEQVARELYGELSGKTLTKAKDRIGKTLWSGAKQNRWQRVPGQLGQYTLDLKLVKAKAT